MANKIDTGPNQLVFIINIDALFCQGIIWITWWYNTPLYCVSVSLSSIATSAEVYLGHAMSAGPCWRVIQPNNLRFATLGAQIHCCFANSGDKTRSLSNTWVKWQSLPLFFMSYMEFPLWKMKWEILLVQNTISEQMACKSGYGHWAFPLLVKVAYLCFQTEQKVLLARLIPQPIWDITNLHWSWSYKKIFSAL